MHAEVGREMQILGAHVGGKVTMVSWASKEEEDADSSKLLKNIDLEEVKKNVLETRAVAWEEAEQSKYLARCIIMPIHESCVYGCFANALIPQCTNVQMCISKYPYSSINVFIHMCICRHIYMQTY